MSQISNVVGIVANLLRGQGGLQTKIDDLVAAEGLPALKLADYQLIAQNLTPEIAERSTSGKYPSIYVYCEKVANQLREKFRTFSGQIGMAIEVRVSADRVGDLDVQMNLLVDAVTGTLDQNRGDLGAGIFYGGGYEVGFAVVKHGGRNFLQTAKVTFDLEVSRN
jgi:hypothetical protein